MNNIERDYLKLLHDVFKNGELKEGRNGKTLSVFGRQIRHKMSNGFPLLTTKKMPFRLIVTELMWFLRGDTNIKYLVDNDCHIWDGDCFANYVRNFTKYVDSLPEDSEIEFIIDKDKFINRIKTDDEFAKKWGDLGPIYSKQWRSWGRKNVVNYDLENVKSSDKVKVMDLIRDGGDYSKYDVKVTYQNNSIDQITNLINDLKTNPDSRRLMVSAWNVGELDQMVLPPCHYGFQVYTRELSLEKKWELYTKSGLNIEINGTPLEIKHMGTPFYPKSLPQRAISLMWNQRSADVFLGLPFNIASYGLLLEIIAKAVNMMPDELIGNLGDTHLYSNHIEQAKEQLTREPYPLPTLNINTEFWPDESGECGVGPIDAAAVFHPDNVHFYKSLLEEDIQLSDYQSHPTIKALLSN